MREIFGWAGIGHFDKRLRVAAKDAHPKGNIYLHFLSEDTLARTYLASEGVVSFDLLPAWAPSANIDERCRRWILQARVPWNVKDHEYGGNWLVWDRVYGKVFLSKNIHPRCIVRLTGAKRFGIEVEPEAHEALYRLCMDVSMLTETQIAMGFRDVHGVSFRKNKTGNTVFCLESPVA